MKKKLDNLSFEELKLTAADMQKQLGHFMVVRQDLIDTRDRLDNELARFRVVQQCNEALLVSQSMEDFSEKLLESMVEAFEFEVAIFFKCKEESSQLEVIGSFGIEDVPAIIDFNLNWITEKKSIILSPSDQIFAALSCFGLGQAMIAPYYDNNDKLTGIILGGHTVKNQNHYAPIGEDLKSSFLVMVDQAGSLLSNYKMKSRIQAQNIQLKDYSENLEKLVDERTLELKLCNDDLEIANQFIKKTFGRYLSDDIVRVILDTPDGLAIKGENRRVTVLMSDLRGFTSISERLPAEDVLSIVNIYLSAMTEIILKFNGTIDEFIGDSVLALFGAPTQSEDDHEHAVACALEMQLAMKDVNRMCHEKGYPRVEQGIGINTGNVVVGNIGSDKRTKYSVVGRNVNTTARIESYTVGGQIMISQSTRDACGDILKIVSMKKIKPKGLKDSMIIYEVGGIKGQYNISLPEKGENILYDLPKPLYVQFSIIDGKIIHDKVHHGKLARIGDNIAEIQTEMKCDEFTNIKLSLFDEQELEVTSELFAKVAGQTLEGSSALMLNFTFVPQEAEQFLELTRQL